MPGRDIPNLSLYYAEAFDLLFGKRTPLQANQLVKVGILSGICG